MQVVVIMGFKVFMPLVKSSRRLGAILGYLGSLLHPGRWRVDAREWRAARDQWEVTAADLRRQVDQIDAVFEAIGDGRGKPKFVELEQLRASARDAAATSQRVNQVAQKLAAILRKQ